MSTGPSGAERARRPAGSVVVGAIVALCAGCEVTDVQIAEVESLVVVEALVQLTPGPTDVVDRTFVLLHRTFSGRSGADPVAGASVILHREDGTDRVIAQANTAFDCAGVVVSANDGSTCYGPLFEEDIRPGEVLGLTVTTAEGEVLRSQTTVPLDFEMIRPEAVSCHLFPETRLEVSWTRSETANAYTAQAQIQNLSLTLGRMGIPVDDPLLLSGLSVSAADTTIVLPSEFGVLERVDLDRDVALVLQEGMPALARADVAIAALDRNYVNWLRGGGFNPSGHVKIPSVVGDGTGFFGSLVVREFTVSVEEERPSFLPPCQVTPPA